MSTSMSMSMSKSKSTQIEMQDPTDEAARIPVPTEDVIARMVGTVPRKVAMRTFPWLLRAAELYLVDEAPLQDAKRPRLQAGPPLVAKRPRLEASTDTVIDDDANAVDLRDDRVAVPVPATPITDDDATPPVVSVPNAEAKILTLCKWSPEEDANLTHAVKKFGNKWIQVARLVVGRTNDQCRKRWVDNLDPAVGVGLKCGKWTRVEDALLTTAVQKFGNEWSAVAALVPGRTNIQCRQRWARGLDPAGNGGTSGYKRCRFWTPQEDAMLTDAANKHGYDWTVVAALVPGRTNAQCRQRWASRLIPANGAKRKKWTPEQDAKLIEAVGEFGKDWIAVSSQIKGRTNIQCRQRWLHSLDLSVGVKGGKWTPKEDAKLSDAVKKFGNDWCAVAAIVPGRTNGQCCQRWNRSLNPDVGEKCRRWNSDEDAKLIEGAKTIGNDWTVVATLVPDRKNVHCGKRWASMAFDPDNGDKGEWTAEEDAKLTEAIKKLGDDWPAVAALIPRRGNAQCRQRWLYSLFPADKWTSEEDIKLIEAVGECGDDWTTVAPLVPGRTNVQCGERWARAFGTANGCKGGQWWTPEEDAKLTETVQKLGNN